MIPMQTIKRLRPDRYVRYWFSHPRRAWRTHVALLRHPLLVLRLYLGVPGLAGPFTLALLWDSVMHSGVKSPNVVEVGAYKGLSTCCLSRAAAKCGRLVWTYDWFQGLPEVQNELDAWTRAGACRSDEATWRANVERHGVPSVCRLIVGDARDTIPRSTVLADEGFCVAFLDVDTYEVSVAVLTGLGRFLRGGETILVHDAFSPGVQQAVAEFAAGVGRPVQVVNFHQEIIRITVA